MEQGQRVSHHLSMYNCWLTQMSEEYCHHQWTLGSRLIHIYLSGKNNNNNKLVLGLRNMRNSTCLNSQHQYGPPAQPEDTPEHKARGQPFSMTRCDHHPPKPENTHPKGRVSLTFEVGYLATTFQHLLYTFIFLNFQLGLKLNFARFIVPSSHSMKE